MTANLTPADAAVRVRSLARRHAALRAWLAANGAEALVAYGSGHARVHGDESCVVCERLQADSARTLP